MREQCPWDAHQEQEMVCFWVAEMWKDFTCVTKVLWLQGNHCQDGLDWENLSADDLVGYPKETRLWVGAIGMGQHVLHFFQIP